MQTFAEKIITADELSSFRERIITLRESFVLLGRGSRSRCAFDLRIQLSRLGYLLTVKTVDFNLLDRVEEWVKNQSLPADLLTDEDEEEIAD